MSTPTWWTPSPIGASTGVGDGVAAGGAAGVVGDGVASGEQAAKARKATASVVRCLIGRFDDAGSRKTRGRASRPGPYPPDVALLLRHDHGRGDNVVAVLDHDRVGHVHGQRL